MSYVRFGEDGSDVYVFLAVGRHLECCGCALRQRSYRARSTDEMLRHLARHRELGQCVPEHVDAELERDREQNDRFIAGEAP